MIKNTTTDLCNNFQFIYYCDNNNNIIFSIHYQPENTDKVLYFILNVFLIIITAFLSLNFIINKYLVTYKIIKLIQHNNIILFFYFLHPFLTNVGIHKNKRCNNNLANLPTCTYLPYLYHRSFCLYNHHQLY